MELATKDSVDFEYEDLLDQDIEDEYDERDSLTSSYKLFISEISKYPLLSDDEVREYAILKDKGDKRARDVLINHNMRLVIAIAKKYRGLGVSYLDLIQEGSLGLMTAVDKYDVNRGIKFSTYAWQWIRQAVSRYIMNSSCTIRKPVSVYSVIQKVKKFRGEYLQDKGRYPSTEEISKELGIPDSTVRKADIVGKGLVSLDKEYSNKESSGRQDSTFTGYDIVPDKSMGCEEKVILNHLKEDVLEGIECALSGRELEVIKLRFGLCEGDNLVGVRTLSDCGEILGVSRERVGKLEKRALRKLQVNRNFRKLKDYVK